MEVFEPDDTRFLVFVILLHTRILSFCAYTTQAEHNVVREEQCEGGGGGGGGGGWKLSDGIV